MMERNYHITKLCLILSLCLALSTQDEDYYNTKDLCKTCKCTNETDIYNLDCRGEGITKTLANWPAHNHTLLATFSYNNITTLKELPPSEYTVKLVLDHCGIKYLESGVFKQIHNIDLIDLSHNLLTTEEISADKFKGAYSNKSYEPLSIKHLNLAYNQIHSIPNDFFEHMQDLIELNLEGNHFKVIDTPTQHAFSTIPNLEILNLANNELYEMVKFAIQNFTTLRELDVSRNQFNYVPFTLVTLGKSLRKLTLDQNPIIELNENSFLGLPNIKELSLNNLPKLENVNANTFATIPNLTILKLSENPKLTTIDQDAFAVNQTLKELYLNNNSIELIYMHLLPWHQLEKFEMSDNPLICTCELYEITLNLSERIKFTENGPICVNIFAENNPSLEVFRLNESICTDEMNKPFSVGHVVHHFHMMRWFLVSLSIFLTLVMFVAIALGITKYRGMNKFIATVSYNPVNTQLN